MKQSIIGWRPVRARTSFHFPHSLAHLDLTEPNSGPSLERLTWWRRLPLTAQLGLVGMLVAFAWFLAARMSADRALAEAHARTVELGQLNQAELAAARVLGSVATMAAAGRSFILSGDEEQGKAYERARRSFLADVVLIHEFARTDARLPGARLTNELSQVEAFVSLWDREVVGPNFELRRRGGLAAFGPGTVGARRVRRGMALTDSARTHHAQVVRVLRDQAIGRELASETSAAFGEWETFLIRSAALAVFLLLMALMMRVVARALHQVIGAAAALDVGRYEDARLPNVQAAPNREIAHLAYTFDRLAQSIAIRERQLQEDIEKLTELERLKADFVSTVSHELRTPLTSMRGALGLVLGGLAGEVSEKGRGLLRIALTNTDRLIRLINDILDIEKIDAGQTEIRRSRVRVRSLLETTISGLEGFARDGHVRLVLLDGGDAEVMGDADRLIQVFTNLGSNAVKYSPNEGAVEFSARPERDRVVISVRDHGPGITEEFASRIFGRFQQSGGAESRRPGGTGLGLSIAKSIAELHGGQIGFDPAEGGGTRFWVALPTVAPEALTPESERPAVLVVEDDDSMRQILCALIEPFARPIGVADARSAIAMLAAESIKVVVLDHGLPDIDGLALTRALRADERLRRSTILLYSAQEFGVEELRASGIRATDAFVKARDPESALIDRIRKELSVAQ